MASRRKPRVVWLPPDGTSTIPLVPESGLQSFVVSISTATPNSVAELPLTIDAPQDITTASLADVENSGYRLRRIVGKIWVIGDTFDDESGIEVLAITAGLIVRRVNQAGSSLAFQSDPSGLPIDPAAAENWGDPWIWRRSWLLGNPEFPPLGPSLPTHGFGQDAGSALDGPHVDQKTARLVGPEERLFLDVSAQAVFAGGQGELTNDTTIVVDLRVLGSMKTSTGNRRNSSR